MYISNILDNAGMTFTGTSYASWRFLDTMERRLSLSLQIKTFQQHARIMHAVGRVDYSILEVKILKIKTIGQKK